MSDTGQVPVFGRKIDGCAYVVRPSVYCVICRGDRIAAVQTPKGIFLPGGGIDADETAEDALAREVREECGFVLDAVVPIGPAVEIVHSAAEHACFEKRGAFFGASARDAGSPTEPDHQLLWLTAEEASRSLSHESHRWAVRMWRRSCKIEQTGE